MAIGRVSLTYNGAELAALLSGPAGGVARDIQRRGNRVLNQARRNCPVDEGRLRASITLSMTVVQGRPVARIGSNLPYAVYVHEGTGVYAGRGYITPKRGAWLRWPVKNNTGTGRRRYRAGATARYAFAKRVKGVPPRPFLRDALSAAAG